MPMKSLLHELRAALAATVVLAAVCGGLYPLAVFAIGQLAFPKQANGSLILDADGSVLGSELLGQNFTHPKYFHPRPSVAGVHGYDASNSGGSNLGPTSRALRDAIEERLARYRSENRLDAGTPVPADAVTASASGLDPHISPRNAELQSGRVARARGWNHDKVLELIQRHLEPPAAPLRLGAPRVNVLLLNRALDNAD